MTSKPDFYAVSVANRESVVFINGIHARSIRGFFWLWWNLPKIIRSIKRHHGSFELLPALVSPVQVMMVSYWYNDRELADYYNTGLHREFICFVQRHPRALAMYFEKFTADESGRYV